MFLSFAYYVFFLFTGLDNKLRRILVGGYRPSTARTYSSVQRRYAKFCTLYNLDILPATELTVLRFIAHITPQVSANSLQVYLAAIRAFHVLNGFEPPPITTPRVNLVLRSLSQTAPLPKQAFPITFHILSQFYSMLTNSFNDLALWACMNVLFFGCLRAAELVPAGNQYSQGFLPPMVSHLQFAQYPVKAVLLKVARTKTRPQGRLIVLGCSGHQWVCPFCALLKYLHARSIKDTQHEKRPLFVLRDGSVLEKSYVRSRQNVMLRALGLPPEKFTTHSYRSGSATQLSINGFQGIIPQVGDWSSLCYLRYIRSPLSALAGQAAKFVPLSS